MGLAVIVSKTKMSKGVCVGAVTLDGTGIRLLDADGHNQPSDTSYNIGDIWELTYKEKTDKTEPHNEDVLVTNSQLSKKGTEDLHYTLVHELKVKIWEGSPNSLFDNNIQWTSNGSGYISRSAIPDHSVGFYITQEDMKLIDDKHYAFSSSIPFSPIHKLAYVGFQNTIEIIPKGTLIRVSLARWWKPDTIDIEERCYVQLSGWYLPTNSDKIILVKTLQTRILVKKGNTYAVYNFDIKDNINQLDIGDEINWLNITDRKVKYKETGEYYKENEQFVYWAEKTF